MLNQVIFNGWPILESRRDRDFKLKQIQDVHRFKRLQSFDKLFQFDWNPVIASQDLKGVEQLNQP